MYPFAFVPVVVAIIRIIQYRPVTRHTLSIQVINVAAMPCAMICANCPQLVQSGFEPYCCFRCGAFPGHHGPWCHHRYFSGFESVDVSEPITCRSCGEELQWGEFGVKRTLWCRPCWFLWLAKLRVAQTPHDLSDQDVPCVFPTTVANRDGLPSPIFVVGLPKCGTTTLHHALKSAGYGSVHCYAPKPWGPLPGDRFVGQLIVEAVAAGLEPLALLPPWVTAITQLDCWWIEGDGAKSEQCYAHFPQITLLEKLVSAYPGAKFVLCTRDAGSWLRSVTAYGPMRHILTCADIQGLPPGKGWDDDDLRFWFNHHNERVRDYFAAPEFAGKLVELRLEEDDVVLELRLSTFIGVDVNWGRHNVSHREQVSDRAVSHCQAAAGTCEAIT